MDIVEVSEGTYVVREYPTTHPHPPLHVVVLAGPLPRPDRVFYPPTGSGPGYGIAGVWETHLLLDISKMESSQEDIQMSMPMIRSLIRQGPLYRQRSLCPVPGVRLVALLPLTAAVATPPGPSGGSPKGSSRRSARVSSTRARSAVTSCGCCGASAWRATSAGGWRSRWRGTPPAPGRFPPSP
ncbi:MAG: hypothetical protein ACRDYZ_15220 [Acidimicrobiales bacterium]